MIKCEQRTEACMSATHRNKWGTRINETRKIEAGPEVVPEYNLARKCANAGFCP